MLDSLFALSSTAYSTSAYQAKLEAARAAQRNEAAAEVFAQNSRNNRAAEQQAGAQAAQQTFGRLYDARGAQTKPTDDTVSKDASNLRSRGLFGDTDLSQFAAETSDFRLEALQARAPQTIASLQAPQVALDSAAFVNLFAELRPSLNLAVNNSAKADVESQPFQRATATLARVYGGLDELAIDIAA